MSENPVVIITGASSGIGAATARLLSGKGYRLSLAARRLDRLEALAGELKSAGGQALPIATDVTDLEDIRNLVQSTLGQFGAIDVLFNNAGIGRIDWLERLDQVEDIEFQIQVNLTGVIQVTRQVLPHMIERRSGHIINMSSVAGLIPVPAYSVYAATKYGLRGFTEALRRELRPMGIQVSGIYPSGVKTEFRGRRAATRASRIRTPDSLRMDADDVARAVLKLIRRPRRALVIPAVMRLAAGMNAVFPELADRVIAAWYARRGRG
ncbi:MAG TPA: SDR family oxidoreductase [Anaerolineales bacterium]|nr:SDR family oxidoreductase [Anaerolineales bacterium]